MPSQSVEAATREEAIAAAREEYGPSVKIVGVRRIRSGGVLGFFAAERFVAEVDLSARAGSATPGGRADDRAGTAARGPDDRPADDASRRGRSRAAESADDRMDELADLLGGPASSGTPIGLYSSAGVAQTPDIEDVLAQHRPRATASPTTAAPFRSGAPGRAAAAPRTAASAIGDDVAPRPSTTRSTAAPSRAPASTPSRTAASASRMPASGSTAAAPGRFAAAVQAAAAAPASPFTPSRYRPTLDRHVDPAPEPVAAAAPAGPSPFTTALARMVADRQVSVAVTDAVERSTGLDDPAEELVEEPVFRVPAGEWVDEDEVPEATPAHGSTAVPAPAAPPQARPASAHGPTAAPAAAPAPAPAPAAVPTPAAAASAPVVQPAPAAPVAEAPAADLPPVHDKRAALQSALQSVLRSAQSTDPDMERLLEGVLDRVLSGETGAAPSAVPVPVGPAPATAAPAPVAAAAAAPPAAAFPEVPAAGGIDLADEMDATLDELASRGRHRFPEPVAAGHPATMEMAAARPDGAGAATDAALEELTALTTDRLDDELAGLVEDRSADDWAADWADDVRVREAQVHDLRREVVLDVRGNEVLAHREPLVMTPSMAAWPALARTASDPAPLSMDATTILPPLSLLPPQRMASGSGMPPLLRGRPAVPPSRRAIASGPSTISHPAVTGRPAVPVPARRPGAGRPALEAAPHEVAVPSAALTSAALTSATLASAALPEVGARLATVTRLVPAPTTQLAGYGLTSGDELVVRLLALGLPEFLIAPDFAGNAAVHGLYAALTRTLSDRLAPLPEVPSEPGSVLLVVGPGPETLAAARSLAVSVRLDPARVQWATPGDSATLAPEHSRITTLETAAERHRVSERAGTVTIVAVDAPLRTGGGTWLAHMLSIWGPDAVWGAVDATRKLEDVVPWLDGLPRLDAVVVQEIEATADPAAVLSHLTAPVARIDGARATAHRWASLLCERLEEMDS